MQISKELIARFFEQRCTAEEARQVSAHLEQNPALLDEYLREEEWEAVRITKEMPAAFWEESWQAIQQEKRKGTRLLWMKRASAAAAILLLLGVGAYWWSKPAQPLLQVAKLQPVHIRNTSTSVMEIVLEDSSRVQLSPASILTYQQPFGNKRLITVEGEAVFDVAKDERPFTVNSHAIATTALGTRFRVLSFAGQPDVKVQLYEGKVVVSASDKEALRKDGDKHYLQPGETLLYNKQLKTTRIIPVSRSLRAVNNKSASPGTSRAVPSWYMFDKTSLSAVFDQLSAMYDEPVIYATRDVDGLYFIGRFEQTDSLKNILRTICELNNLKLEQRTSGGYKIKK